MQIKKFILCFLVIMVVSFTIVNFLDNRQQDKLIFGAIDNITRNAEHIKMLGEFDARVNEFQATENKINLKLIEKIEELKNN